MPGPDRRAAGVPGARELVAGYEEFLAGQGRGSACYRNAAWAFLGRWPDLGDFEAAPLEVQLGVGASGRPFLTYLMLTGRLRPGYDYLAHRKIGGLLAQASATGLAADIRVFTSAATDLDYSARTVRRSAERVIVRVLIQTGRRLGQITAADLQALSAAFARSATEKSNARQWSNDRGLVSASHRVLFHLGVLPAPPGDPRRRPGLHGAWGGGVADPLRRILEDYCQLAAATRAPATVKSIASHLGGFGRFLAACDPPVSDLSVLDRHDHIEAWLAHLAQARRRDGAAISIGHRRGQILTVRQFLADIAEWGWPAAPARTLIFARDIPRAPHALPRYLPPDSDRRLQAALRQVSTSAPSALARLHADTLLLIRATGMRIGEARDLELDCVHQIHGHGAWLKVPLGKLATERMIPLDDETLTILDRITTRRTPGRPLPHPRTGHPVDFLLTHQGRRPSAQALREELTRACQDADLPVTHPHALRHTYATALVNAGLSLQALMQLLGHSSAAMSLRYGRLFDPTVRSEYERALTHAKTQLATHAQTPQTPAGPTLPLEQITAGRDWRDTPLIKTRLAGGFCLRAPSQGPCAYANICEYCPAYHTEAGCLETLSTQHADTLTLARDAHDRGWDHEANRHSHLADRLDELISTTTSESR